MCKDCKRKLHLAIAHFSIGRLSTKSGGDPGMVFDEFDAKVEQHRKGVVSVDQSRFEAAVQLLDDIHSCQKEGVV